MLSPKLPSPDNDVAGTPVSVGSVRESTSRLLPAKPVFRITIC